MALEIETTQENGAALIKPAGEVDLYTSPSLRKAILDAMKRQDGAIVDLSEVAYMDSSGVATLVEGMQTASKKKGRFLLRAPSESVMKVLKLARLDAVFDIEEQAG